MAIILHIDTALEIASIALSKEDQPIDQRSNTVQKDHALWLHNAIDELLKKNDCTPQDLDAVAVTIGPGSYTGLRVGLSTAKGICFALQIPLLSISNLQLLASAIVTKKTSTPLTDVVICPLIDARRMEVFYGLYDQNLSEIIAPASMILDEASFNKELELKKIIFCGNAIEKIKKVCAHPNALYNDQGAGAGEMTSLAFKKFVKKEFADLAYCSPLYIKEFQHSK